MPFPEPAVRLLGISPYFAGLWSVWGYAKNYRKALPGMFIPNWSHGTYAACALVSRKSAGKMRLVGFAHADQDHYYRLLSHYEPMIHRFVAVSEEIAVQKRVLDLLIVAQLLVDKGVNFTLDIYGDEGFDEAFNNAVAELPATTRQFIRLHRAVAHERISEVWFDADVCLLTSAYEGVSISMLEAMAHGCVPVVTRVSGVASVVHAGLNGYFAEDRALLAQMGRAARATIDDHFCPERYAKWFRQMTTQVWRAAPRPFPRNRSFFPPGVSTPTHRWHFYTKRWLLKTYVAGMDLAGLKTPRRNSPWLKSS